MNLVIAGLAFLSVVVFFFGLARLASGESGTISSRLEQYATRQGPPLPEIQRQESPLFAGLNRALARRSRPDLARELAMADLKLTASEFGLIQIGAVLVFFLAGFAIFRQALIALPVGVVGYFAPRWYVKFRQGQRLKAFNDQLPDTIMLLANSLRSGYSLTQSMELISKEVPAPMSVEFGRVVREIGLGLSLEAALANLVRRIASDDLDLMVTAISVQHEVGGNLAQILDIIGHTIRERIRIQGEVRAITAMQRGAGLIISILPIALAGVLFMINPSYMGELFTFPCGWPLVGIGLFGIVTGFIIIRKIVQIEV